MSQQGRREAGGGGGVRSNGPLHIAPTAVTAGRRRFRVPPLEGHQRGGRVEAVGTAVARAALCLRRARRRRARGGEAQHRRHQPALRRRRRQPRHRRRQPAVRRRHAHRRAGDRRQPRVSIHHRVESERAQVQSRRRRVDSDAHHALRQNARRRRGGDAALGRRTRRGRREVER